MSKYQEEEQLENYLATALSITTEKEKYQTKLRAMLIKELTIKQKTDLASKILDILLHYGC